MANFTPEEISEILAEFFDVTGKRQYTGARYVPVFGRRNEDTIAWDNSEPYEPLTIVLYQGNSYTSRTYVPAGIDITNQTYWALTGNYNAQVEQYKQTVLDFSDRITAVADSVAAEVLAREEAVDDLASIIPSSSFDDVDTVKSYIEAQDSLIKEVLPFDQFGVSNTIKDYIDAQIRPTAEEIETAVSNWLDDNPSAVAGDRTLGYMNSSADLNEFLTNGYYLILNNRTLENAPSDYGSSYALLRIYNSVSASDVAYVIQIFVNYTKQSMWARYKSPNSTTWSTWNLLSENVDYDYSLNYIDSNTDLDDCINAGWYSILSNRTLVNAPSDYSSSNSALFIMTASSGSPVAMIFQVFFNYTKNTVWIRVRTPNSTFSSWKQINPTYSYTSSLGYLPDDVNINSYQTEGHWTVLGNRNNLVNAPADYANCTATLMVLPTVNDSAAAQLTQLWFNWSLQKVYMRFRAVSSLVWSEWKELEPSYDNESEYFTPFILPSSGGSFSGQNVGTDLTVMTYNVAHYLRGSTYMSDSYMLNFRKLLQYVNPDVALIAEDALYINGDSNTGSKEANSWLYNNILPNTYETTETTIKSKRTIAHPQTNYLLGGAYRPMRSAVISVGDKNIVFSSLHLSVDSEAGEGETGPSLRLAQITNAIGVAQQIAAEYDCDYIIMGGDFNGYSDTDRENLLAICSSNNMHPANGGWLGWINTVPNETTYGIDNLIVTNNIVIDKYMVLENWNDSLYSDHYPTFAKLTLLD